MRKTLAYISLALVLSACAGAAAPPAGNGNGSGSSSQGSASLSLTISGATQGSTDKILKRDCEGAQFGTFFDSWTVQLNGVEYELGLMAPVIKTPVTIALGPDAKVLLEINDQKTGTGGWRNNDDTAGTVTIDAGADSGSVDAHNLDNGLPGAYKTKLDLKFTFVCPAKK